MSLPSDDPRRKVYTITELGKDVLYADYQRMQFMLKTTEHIFRKEILDVDI